MSENLLEHKYTIFEIIIQISLIYTIYCQKKKRKSNRTERLKG